MQHHIPYANVCAWVWVGKLLRYFVGSLYWLTLWMKFNLYEIACRMYTLRKWVCTTYFAHIKFHFLHTNSRTECNRKLVQCLNVFIFQKIVHICIICAPHLFQFHSLKRLACTFCIWSMHLFELQYIQK